MVNLGNLNEVSQDLSARWQTLVDWFPAGHLVVVALSGGVDSSLVLRAAKETVDPHLLVAVTADSASLPRSELEQIVALCEQLKVSHKILFTQELQNPLYQKNDASRCFHCKSELFGSLERSLQSQTLLSELSLENRDNFPILLLDGLNKDDLGEERPGKLAAEKAGVRHPLVELDIGKSEIRGLAQRIGLPNWDKPAMACLASRIARGVAVTEERLALVEEAEKVLGKFGFQGMRVRLHLLAGEREQTLARIEFQAEDLPQLFSDAVRENLLAELQKVGFDYLTVDLEGYKKGGFVKLPKPSGRDHSASNL